jgi:hypothetical protein
MTLPKPRPPLTPGETRAYPVLPLRDIVVFRITIVPPPVGRENRSRRWKRDVRHVILLATQRTPDDDPATNSIFEVGTLASVLRFLKRPTAPQRAIEGAQRGKVLKYTDRSDYYVRAPSPEDVVGEKVEAEALARSVITEFENYEAQQEGVARGCRRGPADRGLCQARRHRRPHLAVKIRQAGHPETMSAPNGREGARPDGERNLLQVESASARVSSARWRRRSASTISTSR